MSSVLSLNPTKLEPVKTYRIYLLTLHACLSNLALGTCVGWSSPTMPKLRDHTDDSPLSRPITIEEEGWISSIMVVSAFASSLVAGPLANWIGRKWALLMGAAILAVSYILLIVAHSVWVILAARFLTGLSGGFILTPLPMFIGEIATDDCRGGAGSLITFLMTVGVLYSYIIGPYVTYIVLQCCCLAIPIVFLVTFYFIPDTPHYHIIKHRPEEAMKSLQFLRGRSADAVHEEMTQIQAAVEESMANKGTLLDILRNRGHRKALLMICSLLCFQQLSGTTVVTFNSQSIFTSAKSTLDPAIATIILSLVQLVANFITPFVVDRAGRRIILIISSLGMSLALFALGTFFYVQAFSDASAILWLPVPALVLFNLMYAFGLGPIPFAILGEIFPSNIKPIAISIASSLAWLPGFFVIRWFPELNALGPYYSFWLFGSFCFAALLFVTFVLIETKGLNVQTIHERLDR